MSIEKIIRERINQRPDISEQFEKAASLPIGTIRKRPNGNFIKTANGWKYHSSANTSPSTRSDSQETSEKNSLPKVGSVVKIDSKVYTTALDRFKGQNLTVESIVETGLISEPQQVKVKNDKGESIEVSPKDIVEVKSSSRKKYGQEGYAPENTEQLIRDVRKNYRERPLNVQREKIKEAMKKYFPNKATTKKENT